METITTQERGSTSELGRRSPENNIREGSQAAVSNDLATPSGVCERASPLRGDIALKALPRWGCLSRERDHSAIEITC